MCLCVLDDALQSRSDKSIQFNLNWFYFYEMFYIYL